MGRNRSSADTAESDDHETGDSREQGVDIGPLADELESHSYPTTTSELVDEYGDYELDLPKGSQTLEEVLGELEGTDEEYETPNEVRQMIYNAVGSEAVGREGYSDRGSDSGTGEVGSGEDASF
jgi:hypothetical protein